MIESWLNVYLCDGRFLVPTLRRTRAGLWVEVEPVRTAAIDAAVLTALLQEPANDAPPLVVTSEDRMARPVILDHVKARTVAELVREARVWEVSFTEAETVVAEQERHPAGGGWVPNSATALRSTRGYDHAWAAAVLVAAAVRETSA